MRHLATILLLLSTAHTYGQINEELKVRIMNIDTTDDYCNFYMFDSTFSKKDSRVSISLLWVPKADTLTVQKLKVGQRYHIASDHLVPDNPNDSIRLTGHMRTGVLCYEGGKRRRDEAFSAEHATKCVYFYKLKRFL